MLERIPDGFNPDYFIWVESGLGKAPTGLDKLSCPKAAYLIDTHIHFERDHFGKAGECTPHKL